MKILNLTKKLGKPLKTRFLRKNRIFKGLPHFSGHRKYAYQKAEEIFHRNIYLEIFLDKV